MIELSGRTKFFLQPWTLALVYQLHQLRIAVHYVVPHLVEADFGEKFSGAFDFTFLDFPQVHAGHEALSFGDKVHVLDFALLECNGPVRVVVAHWGRDKKATR